MEHTLFQWMECAEQDNEVQQLLNCFDQKQTGLVLTGSQCMELIECHREMLREYGRIEFNQGILPDLIQTFIDSPYLEEDTLLDLLEQLQELFFFAKNQCHDHIDDQVLLDWMRDCFDHEAAGSVELVYAQLMQSLEEDR